MISIGAALTLLVWKPGALKPLDKDIAYVAR